MVQKTYTILSKAGVQARTAAQLVNLASQFESDISLKYNSKTVNLKSIMGVMSLAVGEGAAITIAAEGTDQQEALGKIDSFLMNEIAK